MLFHHDAECVLNITSLSHILHRSFFPPLTRLCVAQSAYMVDFISSTTRALIDDDIIQEDINTALQKIDTAIAHMRIVNRDGLRRVLRSSIERCRC